MKKTLRKHAQDALYVQNASNLSGVVHSFDTCVSDLWELAKKMGKGTDWVNQHPIVQMYVDKLSALSGIQSHCSYVETGQFEKTTDLAEGYVVDWETAKMNKCDYSSVEEPDLYMYVLNQSNHTYYPIIQWR